MIRAAFCVAESISSFRSDFVPISLTISYSAFSFALLISRSRDTFISSRPLFLNESFIEVTRNAVIRTQAPKTKKPTHRSGFVRIWGIALSKDTGREGTRPAISRTLRAPRAANTPML